MAGMVKYGDLEKPTATSSSSFSASDSSLILLDDVFFNDFPFDDDFGDDSDSVGGFGRIFLAFAFLHFSLQPVDLKASQRATSGRPLPIPDALAPLFFPFLIIRNSEWECKK